MESKAISQAIKTILKETSILLLDIRETEQERSTVNINYTKSQNRHVLD
jgi:hypothetical protein